MSDIEINIASARYDQHWNNVECPINSDNESTFIQLRYDQHGCVMDWIIIDCQDLGPGTQMQTRVKLEHV